MAISRVVGLTVFAIVAATSGVIVWRFAFFFAPFAWTGEPVDFAPGTLWFHGADHGVEPDAVLQAFRGAGFHVRERIDDWGGGMFMLVFER